jgi:MPBQ/MSBQ methyltransferase
VIPGVPSYFDPLIEAYRSHQTGRHVHLGYWDDPPPLSTSCSQYEFGKAQARLADVLIGLAGMQTGQAVLDVGCGFGGMLEAVGKRPSMQLTGINIDRRQLDICQSVQLAEGSTLSLVMADACALPVRASSFDRVFCVEAMFHFRERAIFLREAAAALRSGGRLILSDILLRDPGLQAALDVPAIAAALRSEYGPWPQLWVERDEVLQYARRAGLKLDRMLDATRQTLPTYRFTAPRHLDRAPAIQSAGQALRWLHDEGHLSYLCMSFIKL